MWQGGPTFQNIMREANHQRNVAYIVKAWPRLSETFVLNEIISLEQRSLRIHIFSVREPDPGPSHSKVSQVRAKVTCLAFRTQWKLVVPANLRLFCRRPGRYLRVLLQAIKMMVIRHRRFAPPWHFFEAAYLTDILFREPVDHLHAHFASTPALVAMYTHRLSGTPYTFTAHAKDIYVTDPEVFRSKLEEARAVVTCTQYNRRFLSKQYGQLCDGKVRSIYHGLDVSQFNFRLPTNADSGEPTILSVARLVEKKGMGDLIAAADILRCRGRVFHVEIIGSGPHREALKAQAKRLRLTDWVRLPGAQAHDVVCLAYQRASVFVLPCVIASNGDRDGIPNVLLEAMASGVPVVSTPVSGIPELIESGLDGLLVPPNDPAALAEAIDKLLASQELRESLARAARAKIESSFSLDASAERLLALFGQPEQASVDLNVAVAAKRSVPCAEGEGK
jgi:glycosyltransferase involved in cell wall biosynthesis